MYLERKGGHEGVKVIYDLNQPLSVQQHRQKISPLTQVLKVPLKISISFTWKTVEFLVIMFPTVWILVGAQQV